jgi:mannose-6-phosphate isomerase class I
MAGILGNFAVVSGAPIPLTTGALATGVKLSTQSQPTQPARRVVTGDTAIDLARHLGPDVRQHLIVRTPKDTVLHACKPELDATGSGLADGVQGSDGVGGKSSRDNGMLRVVTEQAEMAHVMQGTHALREADILPQDVPDHWNLQDLEADPITYVKRLTETKAGEVQLMNTLGTLTKESPQWHKVVAYGWAKEVVSALQGNPSSNRVLANRALLLQLRELELDNKIPLVRIDSILTPGSRTPWGGKAIRPLLNHLGVPQKGRDGSETAGEAWILSGHKSFPNCYVVEYNGQLVHIPRWFLGEIRPQEVYGKSNVAKFGNKPPSLTKVLNSGSWTHDLENIRAWLEGVTPNCHEAALMERLDINDLSNILDGNYDQIANDLEIVVDTYIRPSLSSLLSRLDTQPGSDDMLSAVNLKFKEAFSSISDILTKPSYFHLYYGLLELSKQLETIPQELQRAIDFLAIQTNMLSKILSMQLHLADWALDKNFETTLVKATKTEAWVILDAESGAGLYLGFRDGVTRDDVRETLEAGKSIRSLMVFKPVKKGDVFHIKAGTAHAIPAGILMMEPQETSETTLRYDDSGRLGLSYDPELKRDVYTPRELHMTDAIMATDWSVVGDDFVENVLRREARQISGTISGDAVHENIVHEEEFSFDRITGNQGDVFSGDASQGEHNLFVWQGAVSVYKETGELLGSYQQGQPLPINASVGKYRIKANSDDVVVFITRTDEREDLNSRIA